MIGPYLAWDPCMEYEWENSWEDESTPTAIKHGNENPHLFSAMMFASKNLTFDRQNPRVPTCVTCLIAEGYPLVNIHKTIMENHHFSWVNPLFQWPFSIAMFDCRRLFTDWRMFSPCRGCDFWNTVQVMHFVLGKCSCPMSFCILHVIQHPVLSMLLVSSHHRRVVDQNNSN